MRINAVLNYGTASIAEKTCAVDKIIELPGDEFEDFRESLQGDWPFIRENAALMKLDTEVVTHCLMVLGEGCDDGVLVFSAGSDAALYNSFIPNARQIVAQEQRYNCVKELEQILSRAVDEIIADAQPDEDKQYVFNLENVDAMYEMADYSPLLAQMLGERDEIEYMDQDGTEIILSLKGWGMEDAPAEDSGESPQQDGADATDPMLAYKLLKACNAVINNGLNHDVEGPYRVLCFDLTEDYGFDPDYISMLIELLNERREIENIDDWEDELAITFKPEYLNQTPSGTAKISHDRLEHLLGEAMCWLSESERGADLYETFRGIGLNDLEIEAMGFTSLKDFFEDPGEDENAGMTMQ